MINLKSNLFASLVYLGFEELANISRRIRHATDASSITGGSSINGNLQEGPDDTDGGEAGGILSNVINYPINNINWFRSEILRLKFGECVTLSKNIIRIHIGHKNFDSFDMSTISNFPVH